MTVFFDREGNQIPLKEWATSFEDESHRTIETTTLANGWVVSTVWNGINYGWRNEERFIFETRVLWSSDDLDHLDYEVYQTLQEAVEGHEKMIKKYQ